jgi:hypothetical protein
VLAPRLRTFRRLPGADRELLFDGAAGILRRRFSHKAILQTLGRLLQPIDGYSVARQQRPVVFSRDGKNQVLTHRKLGLFEYARRHATQLMTIPVVGAADKFNGVLHGLASFLRFGWRVESRIFRASNFASLAGV